MYMSRHLNSSREGVAPTDPGLVTPTPGHVAGPLLPHTHLQRPCITVPLISLLCGAVKQGEAYLLPT